MDVWTRSGSVRMGAPERPGEASEVVRAFITSPDAYTVVHYPVQ